MWNINAKKGSIWSVKNINECDKYYEGMSFNYSMSLILSSYIDENNNWLYTYAKIVNDNRGSIAVPITMNESIRYVDISNIYTGNQKSLDKFVCQLDVMSFNRVIDNIKEHFGIAPIVEKQVREKHSKVLNDFSQQRIHKFGIDILVTENENVKITDSKRLVLSNTAKNDIIYNSKTDDDIRILCDKYKIFPVKAIKEIRNRLVYQHKQREG